MRIGTDTERGPMRPYRLDGERRFTLRLGGWFGPGFVIDVLLHRGQLGLDAGEVFLGVCESRGVAERLSFFSSWRLAWLASLPR